MIEELLAENRRRHQVATSLFDPLAGVGSPGPRFRLHIEDAAAHKELFLPLAMKELPIVKLLRQTCSIRETARRLNATPERVNDDFNRLRALHDFPFWCARYAYIKMKGGGEDALFFLNAPQRRLVEALEEMRVAGKPIRLILLKARQWGGSTCIQIYMAWLQLIHSRGLNSLIISHQGAGTDEIKDMFDRLLLSYPLSLLHDPDEEYSGKEKRMEGVGRSGAIWRVPARNCKVKVGSAERPDSCRGGDYNLVHCSEVGLWRRTPGKMPEQILRSACSGVLLKPMTMIVYESTANGTGNFFHREYEAAKRGESQFRPLFIPWYDIEQYQEKIPDTAAFAAELLAGRHNEGATSDRRQPGAYLWWLWERGATLEGIAWYIKERAKYSDHGLMAAEYPSDDIEAFVHSGARVFDKYRVEALRPGCHAPCRHGEIDSPLLPRGGAIPDDDFRRRRLQEVQLTLSPSGSWKIWELPAEPHILAGENRYLTVVDVGGRSAKADWSVIAVMDREPMTRGEGPAIVAQWRGHTDFDILAEKAALAASFYNDALLVIESNTLETRDRDRCTDGDQSSFLLNRLRRIYPNLYARQQSEEDIRQGLPTRYGFHTNSATKPAIIATLVKIIREGLYTERDEECLDEYLTYERRPNGSFGAILGAHDDLLMTRAIGLHIAFHELDPPRPGTHPTPKAPPIPISTSPAVW